MLGGLRKNKEENGCSCFSVGKSGWIEIVADRVDVSSCWSGVDVDDVGCSS